MALLESKLALKSTMHRPLDGKIALVTGASRGASTLLHMELILKQTGIGAAICRNLASKGASLILNYASPSSTQLTQSLGDSLAKDFGTHTFIVQANLGTPSGPVDMVEAAKSHFTTADEQFGGKFHLDILVNNAGVAGNFAIQDCTIDEFNKQYRVNVLGPLLLVQAALPYLPHDRSGRIVNLSSVSSSLGLLDQSIYGGTKAALDAMTRTWARELAERATVNSINPGPVATDMWWETTSEFKMQMKPWVLNTPGGAIRPGIDDEVFVADAEQAGGRPAYVEEIAGIVGMLCAAEAGWCTGQVVCANGGMRMAV